MSICLVFEQMVQRCKLIDVVVRIGMRFYLGRKRRNNVSSTLCFSTQSYTNRCKEGWKTGDEIKIRLRMVRWKPLHLKNRRKWKADFPWFLPPLSAVVSGWVVPPRSLLARNSLMASFGCILLGFLLEYPMPVAICFIHEVDTGMKIGLPSSSIVLFDERKEMSELVLLAPFDQHRLEVEILSGYRISWCIFDHHVADEGEAFPYPFCRDRRQQRALRERWP